MDHQKHETVWINHLVGASGAKLTERAYSIQASESVSSYQNTVDSTLGDDVTLGLVALNGLLESAKHQEATEAGGEDHVVQNLDVAGPWLKGEETS